MPIDDIEQFCALFRIQRCITDIIMAVPHCTDAGRKAKAGVAIGHHPPLARIEEWQAGHGKPGGRADAARRIDEARRLLDEIANLLVELRRVLMGSTRQR